MASYKEKEPFEKRCQESARILEKYPNRIPVIVEKGKRTSLPQISKTKFLVPKEMTIAEFCAIIQKHINDQGDESPTAQPDNAAGRTSPATPDASHRRRAHQQTLYLLCKGVWTERGSKMSEVFAKYKDDDGFLYFTYMAETVFGC
ncbi:unnamed protein product [Vitrella brassicaformis CCMP3155]|uniref:Autophagy-related protein n=1 Tax=Vitrella brassicaformis (strain CCMP3155) TaxID=1169540 RepID=A0A0G4F9Q6_VITBC|nr:unnamed protein product [Vitrella brassicaformis CCMP3155]|eukprot:CEM09644.1 unnamed protein product [Vitrella brassicaformis CCMP3155]